MTKDSKKTQILCVAGVFAALVFIATGVLPIRIPLPGGGYAHLGDVFVFLAAVCLPQPFALAAAGIGAAAADLFAGFFVYAPFTFVIKAAITLLFTARKSKMLNLRNVAALFGALAVTVGGYYGAEVLLYGSTSAPLANITGNVMQVAVSGVLFIVAAAAFDKAGLKSRLPALQ